jgi:hypothetical protein
MANNIWHTIRVVKGEPQKVLDALKAVAQSDIRFASEPELCKDGAIRCGVKWNTLFDVLGDIRRVTDSVLVVSASSVEGDWHIKATVDEVRFTDGTTRQDVLADDPIKVVTAAPLRTEF